MDKLNNHLNPHTKQSYYPAILTTMNHAYNKINCYYSMTDLSSAYQIAMGKCWFFFCVMIIDCQPLHQSFTQALNLNTSNRRNGRRRSGLIMPRTLCMRCTLTVTLLESLWGKQWPHVDCTNPPCVRRTCTSIYILLIVYHVIHHTYRSTKMISQPSEIFPWPNRLDLGQASSKSTFTNQLRMSRNLWNGGLQIITSILTFITWLLTTSAYPVSKF